MQSKLNFSDAYNLAFRTENIDPLLPELFVAQRALSTVRSVIAPDRLARLRRAGLSHGWSEEDIGAVARFRLIVATESRELIDEMNTWESGNQVQRLMMGSMARKKGALIDLMDQIDALSRLGIQVVWHHVSRMENRPAINLAKEAVVEHCTKNWGFLS
ncbi:hypothetical protein AUEXF2481DRAFT_1355 [Aureobasidium subglaciale EXF-2481]|uniref:RNase H type-1 domain-containing protein n=1 Tax=Aureobasidium subglaciale (strain EXF-2481) TaxID=1043005 RepID=A0A074YQB1_AURSE|nr:uncharacterized protein AUEXF2481DRAFT_1355 [Aureobasidium subglaciale EXF-2481]KEQ99880.1 hypothetical protein AUEXF2481DRAFT_1355 [Aureobasidium subglaciale EXF-2481]